MPDPAEVLRSFLPEGGTVYVVVRTPATASFFAINPGEPPFDVTVLVGSYMGRSVDRTQFRIRWCIGSTLFDGLHRRLYPRSKTTYTERIL